jgi:outer membrane receptor protein involved in Fe transport
MVRRMFQSARRIILLSLLCFLSPVLFAQTTGKISGKVFDARTKEPLIGVNVIIEGSVMGAATNMNGHFDILNVPPGVYSVRASMIGYTSVRIDELRVSIGLTTEANFELSDAAIELGEEVVIIAERPLIQRDLTATSARINSDEIRVMPVEDVQSLINLQAGVVEGHFRGGRIGEVLYMIDGIPVTDVYTGNAGLLLETNAIQELEVISGTFNAEYGQAMSGVVNQVTRDGGQKLEADFSVYTGDYLTRNDGLFMHLGKMNPARTYDAQASLSGPVVLMPNMFFIVTGRMYKNDGHLYGRRIFMPTDSSNFSANDPALWYIQATGDSSYVPVNFEERSSIMGKITTRIFGSNKIDVQYIHQQRDYKNYDHRYRYNPDGTYTNYNRSNMVNVSYTHVFSPRTFSVLRAAWFSNRENSYVYEDPRDPRFPDYRRSLAVSGPAFLTGGAEDLHSNRETRYLTLKSEMTSQITQHHQVKAGFEMRNHRIWLNNFGIRNDESTRFQPEPVYFGRSHFADIVLRPREVSAFLQDKMEYDEVIVNLGFRFDYFHPNADILTEQLRLGRDKQTEPAASEYQISPRFGIAYPISDRGVMYVAYGHFFQVPLFDLMYLNPLYNLNATDPFQVGNPGLKSQRTVQYEIGLQQQMTADIGLYVSAYYKDMRNLIGTEIFDIGNGNKYSQYINRDYGNTRGIIVSFKKRHSYGFSATIDYTFQISKGNASDPNDVFYDNITDPPRESQKMLVPLDWDRRHSINFSGTAGDPRKISITILGSIYSGLPYTPSLFGSRLSNMNSEERPWVINVDLYATKSINIGRIPLSLFVKIYNLFDRRNELQVFSDSGRANYSIEQQYSSPPRGVNSIAEYYTRPDYYSAPRQVILGLSLRI